MIKKLLLLSTFFVLSLLFFVGCTGIQAPGQNDYTLQLPNNYVVVHNNSKSIEIGLQEKKSIIEFYDNNGKLIGIQGYVSEFCYNDRFVGAKQVDIDIESNIDESHPRYYLLDTKKQKIYGPFKSKEQFDKQCTELKISNLNSWKKTNLLLIN
jgi:hypothetical protein